MDCKFCHAEDAWKAGVYANKKGLYQKYRCRKCQRIFLGEEIKR